MKEASGQVSQREERRFIPTDVRTRMLWGAASAAAAALFFGVFGSGALAWNTWGYWVFTASVFCLAFWMHGQVD